ncbi:amyloid fiber anchoring/assembly protein TapA [Neobacillus drentensis]|uniref:amyloid fiber anchoring/assembly protein TapA n=1 Tax=Neobacillus drentensis TaxID=220684 RepID=UPI002FFF2053
MIKIRYKRVRKFSKKNGSIIIVAQIIVVFYLITLLTGYLTSNTEAYFNDNSKITGTIQAGNWENEWDKSSLKFSSGNDQSFESCSQKEITVALTNTGSDMEGPSEYEVYYINKGNPKEGEKVAEGVIERILANKSSFLIYIASKPGNYKFRALQRPNHSFKAERQDLWSETITITCKTKSSDETQKNQLNNNQEKETETQPSQNVNKNENKSLEPEGADTNQTDDTDSSLNDPKPEGADANQTGDTDSSLNDPKPEDADTNQTGDNDSSLNELNSTDIKP